MHALLPGIFNDAPYHRSHIRVADVISYRFRIQDSSFIIHHSYDCDTNNQPQHVPSGLSGPVADHHRSCAYSLLRGVHRVFLAWYHTMVQGDTDYRLTNTYY